MNEKLVKLHPLFTFLALELLVIVAFGLGGNNLIFYILGFILSIFGGVLTIKRFRKNEIFSLVILGVPLLLIAVFVSFGVMSVNNGVLVNISAFIGILSFFALGLFLRRSRKVNPELVLLCIGGGIALVVLVSTIVTWFQYGFFYGLRYQATPIYFYGGERFDVTKEQSWLSGFSFSAVTLRYSGLFGVILLTGFAGMLFLNPKKDLRKFIISGLIGLVGLISLATTPNVFGLLMFFPIMIIAGYIRVMQINAIPDNVKKTIRNVISYAFIAGVILLMILFAIVFLNANGYDQTYGYEASLERVTTDFSRRLLENQLLRKIFNNQTFMTPVNIVLNQASISFNFFGFVNSAFYHTATYNAIFVNTRMFEIEIIKEGGIFAFIVLAFFLTFVIQNLFRYGKNSKDSPLSKGIIVSLMLVVLIYSTFNYEAFPYVHEPTYFNSFFRSLPGLLFLFFIGFTFYPDLKKGEVPEFENEITLSEERLEKDLSKASNDDYVFDVEDKEEAKNEK